MKRFVAYLLRSMLIALPFYVVIFVVNIVLRRVFSPDYNIFHNFIIFTLSFLAISTLIYFLLIMLAKANENMDKILLETNGYCDEYFDKKIIRINKEKNLNIKQIRLIEIAFAYNNAHNTEKAIEYLNRVELKYLNNVGRAQFFNAYAYILLMAGDLKSAERFLKEGELYFPYAINVKYVYEIIEHTYAIVEYLKNNLVTAENMLLKIISKSTSKYVKLECDMYLALIYLRTDRRAYAKQIISNDASCEMTLKQKFDFLKLKKLVDEAYEINDSDHSDASNQLELVANSDDIYKDETINIHENTVDCDDEIIE